MAEFDVHFDNETVEALRRQICATVDENRDRTGLHSMGVSILCTRLMVDIEEKLFELRRQPSPASREIFSRFADIVRQSWGVRSHVNSNDQTLIVWDEHGTSYAVSIEEQR